MAGRFLDALVFVCVPIGAAVCRSWVLRNKPRETKWKVMIYVCAL